MGCARDETILLKVWRRRKENYTEKNSMKRREKKWKKNSKGKKRSSRNFEIETVLLCRI